jgi:anti-sigma factor RsiW
MTAMETCRWTAGLSAYLDDELAPAERAAVDRHLTACSRCALVLDDLRMVVAAAAELSGVAPERDLWPGIRGRLIPRAGPAATDVADPKVVGIRMRRRVAMTVPQLVAAGITVALLGAAVVWAVMGAATAPYAPAVATPGPADVVLAAYQPAMTELEAAYAVRRSELEPETVLVVERNLAIIDAAIREATEALEADPSSGFLHAHLADTMRRRLSLLRQVALT